VAFENNILDTDAYPIHQSLPLRAADQDTLIYVVSGVVSAVLVVVLLVLVAALYRSRWTNQIKRSTSSQIYVKDAASPAGTLSKAVMGSLPDITRENTLNSTRSIWRDNDSACEKNSIRKSPVPSISDNLSWRYCQNRAVGQEVASTHRRVHADANSASTDSSMYSSSNESDTTASAEFILGAGVAPRISVMEDYTVYRDLSHLGSINNDYFSFSQLPQELQGITIVPYSPGYMDTMESSKSRRHISLV